MTHLRLVQDQEGTPAPVEVYIGAPGWTEGRMTQQGWYYAMRRDTNLTEEQRQAGIQPCVSGESPQALLIQITEQNQRERRLAEFLRLTQDSRKGYLRTGPI